VVCCWSISDPIVSTWWFGRTNHLQIKWALARWKDLDKSYSVFSRNKFISKPEKLKSSEKAWWLFQRAWLITLWRLFGQGIGIR
jgi:hypothetical protein